VVRDFIYPALSTSPTSLSFSDQIAFQPLASTTAALIHLLLSITSLMLTNEFVVYALDFSKAFDSVRHSTVLSKMSLLDLPDNIYNWIESFSLDIHTVQSLEITSLISVTSQLVLSKAPALDQFPTLSQPPTYIRWTLGILWQSTPTTLT